MTETQAPEIWNAGLALVIREAGMGGRNRSNNPEAPTRLSPASPQLEVFAQAFSSPILLKATYAGPNPSGRVNNIARNQQLSASGPRLVTC